MTGTHRAVGVRLTCEVPDRRSDVREGSRSGRRRHTNLMATGWLVRRFEPGWGIRVVWRGRK